MKAAQITHFGHADAIEIREVPRPTISEGLVLIEVCGSSINPVDAAIREGQLKNGNGEALPLTLGDDVAGIVVDVAPGVTHIARGDSVFGQASVRARASGAFAEYAATPANCITQMPANLSYVEAATLPLAGCSALEAIEGQMILQPDQKILIHGGAGGIGTAAIQIAKDKGAYVCATAAADCAGYVRELGADDVIDYEHQSFEELCRDCDAVLDTVGGDTYLRSFNCLKPGGMIVSMLEKPDVELTHEKEVKASLLMTKVTTEWLNRLRDLCEKGVITPQIDRTYSLSQIQEAFLEKEHSHVHGKIAVEVRRRPQPSLGY